MRALSKSNRTVSQWRWAGLAAVGLAICVFMGVLVAPSAGAVSGPGYNMSLYVAGMERNFTIRWEGPHDANYTRMQPLIEAARLRINQITGANLQWGPDAPSGYSAVNGEITVAIDSSCPAGAGGCTNAIPAQFRIVRADVRFPATVGSPFSWPVAALHEMGHAVGLAHFDDQYNGGLQIMNSSSASQSTLLGATDYQAGDINGLQALRDGGYVHDPVGAFDAVKRIPGGVSAIGWAQDPDQPATASLVAATVDGSGAQFTANQSRSDVGPHGFGAPLPAGAGSHNVCVAAINLAYTTGHNVDLGCKPTTVSNDPIGSFEPMDNANGGFNVHGWAFDPDTATATTVHIYVDGVGAAILNANASRADLSGLAGYDMTAYSTNHGYNSRLGATPGTHSVCAYAINNSGAGSNQLLGCQSGTVSGAPFGAFEAANRTPGGVAVSGWATDPSAPTTPIQVHVYVDGVGTAILTANSTRTDVGNAYPGYGNQHGYSTTLTGLSAGNHTICTYGIDQVGNDGNTTLGCRVITISNDTMGAFDTATSAPGSGSIAMTGWAMDPDTASPVYVAVYIDGVWANNPFTSADLANTARPDLAVNLPGYDWATYGPNHGFSITKSATPNTQHLIQLYAMNTSGPGSNTFIGSKTVTS